MPKSFNKSFRKSEMQAHYYVFDNLFIIYEEALNFCETNKIPFDFIIKTKYYVN